MAVLVLGALGEALPIAAMLRAAGLDAVRPGDGSAGRPRLAAASCVVLCMEAEAAIALLRRGSLPPALVIPPRRVQQEVIALLSAGADDVLPRPVHPVELSWRVRNLLRRADRSGEEIPVKAPPLSLLVGQGLLKTPSGGILLSSRETAVLAALMRRPGIVRPRGELVDECWPDGVPPGPREVDYVVCLLRRKLGPWGARLLTRPGFGYLFDPALPPRRRGRAR